MNHGLENHFVDELVIHRAMLTAQNMRATYFAGQVSGPRRLEATRSRRKAGWNKINLILMAVAVAGHGNRLDDLGYI